MSLESEDKSLDECAEDGLARRAYHLNMLFELNQEISTLRNVQDVMEASLLYMIGAFGLRNGLVAIYRDDSKLPNEFVYRGISKDAVVIGAVDRVSIWSPDRYKKWLEQEDSDSSLTGIYI